MISLIITTLHVGDYLDRCISSFDGQYDQLIIADTPGLSLAENINRGLRRAIGNYIVVSNDDLTITKGTLRDLCHNSKVISPTVNGSVFKVFHGHLFCMPRNIYAEVGGFDETCPGVYHIDSDYWIRLINAGYPPEINDKVDVKHEEAVTIKTLPEQDRNIEVSREWFVSKWGEEARGRVGA